MKKTPTKKTPSRTLTADQLRHTHGGGFWHDLIYGHDDSKDYTGTDAGGLRG